jgi:hypothetical protein
VSRIREASIRDKRSMTPGLSFRHTTREGRVNAKKARLGDGPFREASPAWRCLARGKQAKHQNASTDATPCTLKGRRPKPRPLVSSGVAAHTIQPSSRALATAVRKASSSISWSSVFVVGADLGRANLSIEVDRIETRRRQGDDDLAILHFHLKFIAGHSLHGAGDNHEEAPTMGAHQGARGGEG